MMLLLLAIPVSAQSLPDAPSHRFLNRPGKILTGSTILIESADAWATHRNSTGPGFYELNPISQPFVTHGAPLLYGFFVADASLKIGCAYMAHRTGHHHVERTIQLMGVGASTWGVTQSSFGYHSKKGTH
jgi:hypothetical protein